MRRFRNYVDRVGGSMSENPSPGNKEGGLLNITIKSLGALAKAGRAPVEGVLDYGQLVWERGKEAGFGCSIAPAMTRKARLRWWPAGARWSVSRRGAARGSATRSRR